MIHEEPHAIPSERLMLDTALLNQLTTNEQVKQPFRYSGEFWDSAIGLQYLRARWYDPIVGRFIKREIRNAYN
ncbi:MAG: hypothetical protein K6T85_10575 [Gorillibacterium sp.]|nr:hypothetical protein [Gorillibacterium sp.]